MMNNQDFNKQIEFEVMSALTSRFGLEVFTPGLERTAPVYQFFINHFKDAGTRVIIVAGTNGKGQTAHTLTSFLSLENKNIGLWTSPHILSLRERFVFASNGQIAETTYDDLKDAIRDGDRLLKEEMKDIKVSFYEFLFLAFLIMAQKKKHLDYLILEVGLGGRLDAVNHFDADATCITSISRDHQGILGHRYDQILFEKIAVSRRNRPLFTNFNLEYLNSKTSEYVSDHGINWVKLPGADDNYFLENQKMAWEIFHYFVPNTSLTFKESIAHLPFYKGRREMMTFLGKSLIFIGAHNIDGVRRMLQSYLESDELIYPESLLISFSQRPIGEVEVMLKSLVDFFKDKAELKLTSFDHPKALDEESVREAGLKVNKGMLNFVFDWKSELKNSKSKTILVCGSYYFIGEVQRFINS